MKKHAICILAHKNWEQLEDLINTLGSQYVDIYLHVDKKQRTNFDCSPAAANIKGRANLCLINSINVNWGGYSQLLAEIALFNEVLKHKEHYSYVHLISGQDFPIKPVSEIVKECDEAGCDYISSISGEKKRRYERRLKYRHILVPRIRTSKVCNLIRKIFLAMQMMAGVNRLRKCPLPFEVGANWMSITISSLEYIVGQYHKYEKFFMNGISAEECYKQMILKQCPSAKIENTCRRYVVFENMSASPKTLTMDMLESIINSGAFFARKFDDSVDKEVRIEIKNRII